MAYAAILKGNDSANARLVNDISFPDLSSFNSLFPIKSFSGHFDGGGHIVHLNHLFSVI